MSAPIRPLRVLHVVVAAGPTNSQYNEHCLPVAAEREIVVCSLFPTSVDPPPAITMFSGDGTFRGCVRVLAGSLRDRSSDVVHVHAAGSAMLLLLVSLLRRRSLHGSVFTMHNSYRNFRLRNRMLLHIVFAAFPAVVLCGEAVRQTLPRPLRWLGGGRIRVAPNGVDLERVDRALAGSDGGARPDFTVVSVGRLITIKNPGVLLQAFVRSGGNHNRLVFIGDGELRPALAEVAATTSTAGQVTFTGVVSRDAVYQQLAAADVCVSSSRGEGLPVAVLEAMACGTPVILSDIPPHREIAQRAEYVPLVPPDDVDGFAEQIRRFRRMTPAQRDEIGDRCRALVEERFSVGAMHAAYARIYARVRSES
jgi:glycosyltransferase involved in cell wall biosynthesis